MNIFVPEYTDYLTLEFEEDYSIRCTIDDWNNVVIQANKAGLISLARHLLTLAQDNVPEYTHFHLDDYGGLEKGSAEMIIVRKD